MVVKDLIIWNFINESKYSKIFLLLSVLFGIQSDIWYWDMLNWNEIFC